MKKISFEIPDRDERGVSPVIGVILMVAITVILAAVIATFVLGFGDQVSQSVQAGADISETTEGDATVTWIQEGNADMLTVSTSDEGDVTYSGGVGDGDNNITAVGDSLTIEADDGADSDVTTTVTVTAVDNASDTRTVIVQEEVTLEVDGGGGGGGGT